MPTRWSTSADRSRMALGDILAWAWMVSRNWASMLIIGLRAFMALCITTE